jgi:transcriptional regulatory protein RtcR
MAAKPKPMVIVGMLGPTLDNGHGPQRWSRWRPTVALCQHPDLLVSRFELLFDPRHTALAETVQRDMEKSSPETEVRGTAITIKDPWDFEEVYGALHDFARGYAFEPEREDYLVHITTGTHVVQICLFLLCESRHMPARLIQTGPPTKRSPEPPGTHAIIDLDLSRYDRIASRFRAEQREAVSFLKQGIATRNAAYNQLMDRIEQVALGSQAPMLLMGPTGAGKSQLARRIYELKKARNKLPGELVEVNCATLRGDQAMASLFGHTKGAFTHAAAARAGLLRKADGGLLFLDEIGELGLDEQAMLLRAIEEKVFYPVGADREVRSDFLLLAGTNRDLGEAVAAGRFRADLLSRINLWTFRLPGIASRSEDLEPNLDHETERAAELLGTRVTWSREARARYLAFGVSPAATWLGNFRDLNASITRLATLAHGGRITAELVDEELQRLRSAWASTETEGATDIDALLGKRARELDPFDRVQLAEVIRVCRGSRSLSDAGRKLFAKSRANKKLVNDADRLRKYLARFDLTFADVGAGHG